jgi:hypothetical protein
MGRKIELTDKQSLQILSFFENSHDFMVFPNDVNNSCVIALFRACRDYCNAVAGNLADGKGKGVSAEEKAKYRNELIETLDKLAIRYYERL